MALPARKRPKLSVSLHPDVIAWLKKEAEARHIDVSAVVTLLVNDAMIDDQERHVILQTVNGDNNGTVHAGKSVAVPHVKPERRR